MDKLYHLILDQLQKQCPVLSGNMKNGIKLVSVNGNSITIEIEAPFYDMNEWKKSKKIVHTGKSFNGITNYASIVNDKGAFGKPNRSKCWVNRCLNDCANSIANEYENCEVDNHLPLR